MTVYRRNPLLMTVMGANPGPRTRKTAERALDHAISKAWALEMSGVQVPVLDIPKIFRDIKLELAAGVSLADAVRSVGNQYRVNRNPFGEAIIAGAAGALVNRAFQSNPGPAFVVIDSETGRVMYTKQAHGVGSEAIEKCALIARGFARKFGRSYIIYLDMRGVKVGMSVNVPMVRALGITEEIHPGDFNNNPHLEDQPCATCGGSLAYQGTLGNREHYRCRNCGMDVNTPIVHGIRRRRYRKLCAHGAITATCRSCRGRKIPTSIKPCIHGYSGGKNCLQCMKLQRPGSPIRNNPAIRKSWDGLTRRQRRAILEFAGVDEDLAYHLSGKSWESLGAIDPDAQRKVTLGWRDTSRESRETHRHETTVRMNPASRRAKDFMSSEISHLMRDKGYSQKRAVAAAYAIARKKGYKVNPSPNPGRRKMTMTIERFAAWVKSKRDPAMWKAFLAKFRGYEKWTHGAKARKVTVEWVDTPGVNGLWITYDGGKQPESTYIMPKGSPRKGAWKHPWDTMPDIKHDPEAKIVITKLRGSSKITDFYHK